MSESPTAFLRVATRVFASGIRPLALLAALTLGCVSNPTPHPGAPDADLQFETTPPGEVDRAGVCGDLGGVWDPSQGVCVADSDTFDDGMAASPEPSAPPRADVVEVLVGGGPGAASFTVTIRSDDVDCSAYADWWEVVGFDGQLLHRELLAGPTVPAEYEGTFVSAGGPVAIEADTPVVVRAHFHPEGYVGEAQIGTATDGFVPARLSPGFAAGLAAAPPQPEACVP